MYIDNKERLYCGISNYGIGREQNVHKIKSIIAADSKDIKINQDSRTLSNDRINRMKFTDIGSLTIDKGTASNTTIYVNKSTFYQIASYTTNNPNCQWEELGFDGEKRWVVVNGQRFEYPLSKQEKESIERMRDNCDIFKIFEKEDKKSNKIKEQKKEINKIRVNFIDEKFSINNKNLKYNLKIKNLTKNNTIMKMLCDISHINSGMGVELYIN